MPSATRASLIFFWLDVQGHPWNDTVMVKLVNSRLRHEGDTVARRHRRMLPSRFANRIDGESYEPGFLRHFGIIFASPQLCEIWHMAPILR